jgi:hypothetical protein
LRVSSIHAAISSAFEIDAESISNVDELGVRIILSSHTAPRCGSAM